MDHISGEKFLRNQLQTQPTTFYENEIAKLLIHWQKYINVAGYYVEK